MRSAHFAFLASLVLLGGCGYVGPIMPPSPEIPTQIANLAAVERGDKIEVGFATPPRTTDGVAIKHFSELEVRIGPAAVPFDFEAWAKGAKVFPVTPPPPGDPLDPKSIPVSASMPLDGLIGERVAVAVRTAVKSGDHYSAWSNRVILEVIPPLATPAGLKLTDSADGEVLDWQGSEAAKSYRILRQGPNDKALLEVGNADQPHFVDTTSQFDVPYSYEVIAVSGTAESLPSETQSRTPIDKFPPSVPSGVTALAGPESIELSWQRSPEADTAGYYIYRSVEGGALERLGAMVTLPAFSDQKVEHGKTYRYQISSMDQKNNESEKSATVEVSF